MDDQTAANLLLARTKGLYMLKGVILLGILTAAKIIYYISFTHSAYFSEEEESVRTTGISRTEKVFSPMALALLQKL